MAGVGVSHATFDAPALRALGRDIRRAASVQRRRQLTRELAAMGESGAAGRILRGGPAPDGTAWPARHPLDPSGKKLLNREGGLAQSITTASSATTARWGTNEVYARIHQLGGVVRPRRRRALRFMRGGHPIFRRQVTIPARPYLGWGQDEEREAADVIRDWMDKALPGGAS